MLELILPVPPPLKLLLVIDVEIALLNGFVLFGRAGIKFSRLTSDEFSPRKLSGVFLIGFRATGLLVVDCGTTFEFEFELNGSNEFPLLVDIEVDSPIFHGFVDCLFEAPDPVDADAPKKSPNGSVLAGPDTIAGVLLSAVNRSKSSALFALGIAQGSTVIVVELDGALGVGSHGFVDWLFDAGVFHGSKSFWFDVFNGTSFGAVDGKDVSDDGNDHGSTTGDFPVAAENDANMSSLFDSNSFVLFAFEFALLCQVSLNKFSPKSTN